MICYYIYSSRISTPETLGHFTVVHGNTLPRLENLWIGQSPGTFSSSQIYLLCVSSIWLCLAINLGSSRTGKDDSSHAGKIQLSILMIISFHCPTFLLLVGTPSKIKISLCVDVHTMTLHLVDDFGFDMSAHTAKLSDETLQLSYQPPRLPKQQVGKVATSLGVQKRCDSYHAHSLSSELEPSGRISRVRFQIPVLERSTKLSNRSKVKLVKFSTCSIVVQIDSQEP